MNPDTIDTKDRILDAAEELFAEHGYDATSLRAINAAAGVNVAAIHYHFGSKEALLAALFERRVRDVNDERLRRLDALEREHPEGVPLEDLVRAFLEPPLRRIHSENAGWVRFLRVMGRILGESGRHLAAIEQVFREIQERFFPAFQRALPHLQPTDVFWRMHLLIGSMCHLFSDPHRLERLSQGACTAGDPDESLAQFVAFATGALGAARAETQSPQPSKPIG